MDLLDELRKLKIHQPDGSYRGAYAELEDGYDEGIDVAVELVKQYLEEEGKAAIANGDAITRLQTQIADARQQLSREVLGLVVPYPTDTLADVVGRVAKSVRAHRREIRELEELL